GRAPLCVAAAPPLRREATCVLVVLPKAGVPAARVRFFDPMRLAADHQAAVAGDHDVRDRATPLNVATEAGDGRNFFEARARRPCPGRGCFETSRYGDLRGREYREELNAFFAGRRAYEVPASGELRCVVHRPRDIGSAYAGGEEASVLE